MWNMNSGYHGFSMSNRAIEAYNNGEKPFSKWTKQDILDVIEEYKQESDDPTIHLFYTVFYELAKVRAGVLKAHLLHKSSWHHTSKFCNCTEFYSIDFDLIDSLDLKTVKEWQLEKTKKEIEQVKKYECIYLEWTGTRKHPKANEVKAKGIIKGNWFYPDNENFKKSINANGFKILKEL